MKDQTMFLMSTKGRYGQVESGKHLLLHYGWFTPPYNKDIIRGNPKGFSHRQNGIAKTVNKVLNEKKRIN